jgi:hypothetical protein
LWTANVVDVCARGAPTKADPNTTVAIKAENHPRLANAQYRTEDRNVDIFIGFLPWI